MLPLSLLSNSLSLNMLGRRLNVCVYQGCSLGLERLGLETVSRRFFGTSRLVSVLKIEHLGLVSVLRVQRLGLVSVLKI